MERYNEHQSSALYRDEFVPPTIAAIGLGFWGAATLFSADELGVFSALAEGPLDADILIARLRLRVETGQDFLDALVELGLLEQRCGGYANTQLAQSFLDSGKPSYIGPWLAMARAGMRDLANLTEQLRTPRAATCLPFSLDEDCAGTYIIRQDSREDLSAVFPHLAHAS